MKKKLKLKELKVQSFVTDLTLKENETLKEMKGGTIIITPLCTIITTILEITEKCTETCHESGGGMGCTQIGTC